MNQKINKHKGNHRVREKEQSKWTGKWIRIKGMSAKRKGNQEITKTWPRLSEMSKKMNRNKVCVYEMKRNKGDEKITQIYFYMLSARKGSWKDTQDDTYPAFCSKLVRDEWPSCQVCGRPVDKMARIASAPSQNPLSQRQQGWLREWRQGAEGLDEMTQRFRKHQVR
jgi:hypothetical protein